MKEIERKFLVNTLPEYVKYCKYYNITQWYLSKPGDSIENRLRVYTDDDGNHIDDRCYFDIKISTGMVREEIGQKVDFFAFGNILSHCPSISKRRYKVPREGYKIFVDVYDSGLITAEVEVPEDKLMWLSEFVPESWMSEDVTNDPKYKNINLAYEDI